LETVETSFFLQVDPQKDLPLNKWVLLCRRNVNMLCSLRVRQQTMLKKRLGMFHMSVWILWKKAFAAAASVATLGDTVLLSPGTASFGVFKNEFDRGDQFEKMVGALIKKTGSGELAPTVT
jgi:hypothetical protein